MKKTVILLLLYFCGMACVVQTQNKLAKSNSLTKIKTRKISTLPNTNDLQKKDILDTVKVENTVKASPITIQDSVLSDTLDTNNGIAIAKKIGYFNIRSSFVSLSLVDSTVFNNWDTMLKDYKTQYKNNDLLLLIASKDSQQKADFVMTFYENYSQNNNISKAYSKALKMTRKKYGKKLDFCHYFHIAKID